jgi:hypothetical protein
LPLELFTISDGFQIEGYRKVSAARLIDKIYKITPNGAGLVTGKQVRAGGG